MREHSVLSEVITHHLTEHCISAKIAVIIKMNIPNAFFSAFQVCSYIYSRYMSIPFKTSRTVLVSKGVR